MATYSYSYCNFRAPYQVNTLDYGNIKAVFGHFHTIDFSIERADYYRLGCAVAIGVGLLDSKADLAGIP